MGYNALLQFTACPVRELFLGADMDTNVLTWLCLAVLMLMDIDVLTWMDTVVLTFIKSTDDVVPTGMHMDVHASLHMLA